LLRFKDGGVYVPAEEVAEPPHVVWNHIDGPLMTWCGELHWLTWRERFRIWAGLSTVRDVAHKRWPHLAKLNSTYKRLGELPSTTTVRVADAG
jgi:hypothetical protein